MTLRGPLMLEGVTGVQAGTVALEGVVGWKSGMLRLSVR